MIHCWHGALCQLSLSCPLHPSSNQCIWGVFPTIWTWTQTSSQHLLWKELKIRQKDAPWIRIQGYSSASTGWLKHNATACPSFYKMLASKNFGKAQTVASVHTINSWETVFRGKLISEIRIYNSALIVLCRKTSKISWVQYAGLSYLWTMSAWLRPCCPRCKGRAQLFSGCPLQCSIARIYLLSYTHLNPLQFHHTSKASRATKWLRG